MKLVLVVNNRLFDMLVFMVGLGNVKKVVENGVLFFWKLGCFLNQNSVFDIRGVEVFVREGVMFVQFGYFVVGWYIVNKKFFFFKRIRRQIYVIFIFVIVIGFLIIVIQELLFRIVFTFIFLVIVLLIEIMVFSVRDFVFGKFTVIIRIRGVIIQILILGFIQFIRVLEVGIIVSGQIRLIMIIFGYVEFIVVVIFFIIIIKKLRVFTLKLVTFFIDFLIIIIRRLIKKLRIFRLVFRVIIKVFIIRLEIVFLFIRIRIIISGVFRGEFNQRLEFKNYIDRVDVWVGIYFEVKILLDIFYDNEDITIDKLKLILKFREQQFVGEKFWVQFNSNSQFMYGLFDSSYVGKYEYFMYVIDKGGLLVVDVFEIYVYRRF